MKQKRLNLNEQFTVLEVMLRVTDKKWDLSFRVTSTIKNDRFYTVINILFEFYLSNVRVQTFNSFLTLYFPSDAEVNMP